MLNIFRILRVFLLFPEISGHYVYNFSFDPNENDRSQEMLPNGHTREEYYQQGYSDYDIEFWGLDLYGAPSPEASGWVLMDLMNDNFDGDVDF